MEGDHKEASYSFLLMFLWQMETEVIVQQRCSFYKETLLIIALVFFFITIYCYGVKAFWLAGICGILALCVKVNTSL